MEPEKQMDPLKLVIKVLMVVACICTSISCILIAIALLTGEYAPEEDEEDLYED